MRTIDWHGEPRDTTRFKFITKQVVDQGFNVQSGHKNHLRFQMIRGQIRHS